MSYINQDLRIKDIQNTKNISFIHKFMIFLVLLVLIIY